MTRQGRAVDGDLNLTRADRRLPLLSLDDILGNPQPRCDLAARACVLGPGRYLAKSASSMSPVATQPAPRPFRYSPLPRLPAPSDVPGRGRPSAVLTAHDRRPDGAARRGVWGAVRSRYARRSADRSGYRRRPEVRAPVGVAASRRSHGPSVCYRGPRSRLRAGSLLPRHRRGTPRRRHSFFWLDLDQPDEADFEILRDVFRFHPLAVEDSEHFDQRAKLDDYHDFIFIVVYGATPDGTNRLRCIASTPSAFDDCPPRRLPRRSPRSGGVSGPRHGYRPAFAPALPSYRRPRRQLLPDPRGL